MRSSIPQRPRNPKRYLSLLAERLARFTTNVSKSLEAIDLLPRDFVSDSGLWNTEGTLRYWKSHEREIGTIISNIEAVFTFANDPLYFGRIRGFLAKSLNAAFEPYGVAEILSRRNVTFDDDQLMTAVRDWERWGDPLSPSQLKSVNLIRHTIESAPTVIEYLKDARAKVNEWSTLRTEDRPPPHQNVEVLFHASINARQIARKGFDPTPPNRGGIGGSQSTKDFDVLGISFTDDLYVAKEIARSLKEVVGIANGKYRWQHVERWILADGLNLDAVLKSARQTFLSGRHIPIKYMDRNRGYSSYSNPLQQDPKNVFGLYLTYLSAASTKENPKRYDPVYFAVSINQFKGYDEANIGVVAARVDMTDKRIMYLPAMSEWRVPVSSVLSIEKFIGERS